MTFGGGNQKFTELSEPYREPEKKRRGGFLEVGT
jgi:hypothetical protein